MAKSTKPPSAQVGVSRRKLLVGVGATAALAACGQVPVALGQSADATMLDGDAATSPPVDAGGDVAVDAATDVSASADVPSAGPLLDPITPNERYYVTSCCPTPTVDAASWVMTITDRGKLVATFDMAFLESLKPRDKEHTLECISGGPAYNQISNGIWTGLPLPEIFAAKGVQVPSDVSEMKLTALDGYGTGLPTSDLTLPMWLVWRLNGVPLPPEHGFPARLLVPNRYGMKNPKWIKDLEFVAQHYIGFWESNGWSKTAFYKPNAYIRGPEPASEVKAGKVTVFGIAFAGRDVVTKVDVRVDGGAWQPAILDYFGKPDVWTLWRFSWDAVSGSRTLQARCTTASGAMSLESSEGTDLMSGYNGSMAISVTVA